MKKRNLQSALAAVVLGSLLALGCQQGADRPATYPVTGTVTHNGEAVEGATVSFQLADGSQSAVGVTDATGAYKLTTFEADDGAVAGEYKVAITKYEGGAGGPETDDMMSEEYHEAMAGGGAAEEASEPENVLPPKYADANKSGLTATVSESGENNFDFTLEG
jgi:hypothetical protein